jgi:hypothetical protein
MENANVKDVMAGVSVVDAYLGFYGVQCYLMLNMPNEAVVMLRAAWVNYLLVKMGLNCADLDLQKQLHLYLTSEENMLGDLVLEMDSSLHIEVAELVYRDIVLRTESTNKQSVTLDEVQLLYNRSVELLGSFSGAPKLNFIGSLKPLFVLQLAFYRERVRYFTLKHACDFEQFETRIYSEHRHILEDEKDVWDWNEAIDMIPYYENLLENEA